MNEPAFCASSSTARAAHSLLAVAFGTGLLCLASARAEWTNVTQNVGGDSWGYAGVCLRAAVPDSPAMIAGVSEAGLWRSDDLGYSGHRSRMADVATQPARPGAQAVSRVTSPV